MCYYIMFEYTIEEAEQLIKLARSSIRFNFYGEKYEIPKGKKFMQARGVFVTLNAFPSGRLRGCIGFPYASLPIGKAVADAAKSAAFSDPRFNSLDEKELDKITIELSILSGMEKITKKNINKEIIIGKHGLVCKYITYSGLLLPQVATEYKMSSLEFLEAVCEKAGLPKDIWQNDKCEIYRFSAQVFKEEQPSGKVVEEKLI